MPQNKKSSYLLDYFYQHLVEDDWLDGIELYQSDSVSLSNNYQGLITGKVEDSRRNFEVRLKIHPSGHCIQWLECTCTKNRRTGHYCEHIAAFMLYLDREHPTFFKTLDVKMPIKPPIGKRMRKSPPISEGAKAPENTTSSKGSASTTNSILDHLKGLIRSVKLVLSKPCLRVNLAIKQDQTTQYDLGIDDAANFLRAKENLKQASEQVKQLKHYDSPCYYGFKISIDENDDLVAEKVIAIAESKKTFKSDVDLRFDCHVENAKIINSEGNERLKDYRFFTAKKVSKFYQKKHFLIPELGFFPFKSEVNVNWIAANYTFKYKNKDSIEFIENNFAPLSNLGPVFVGPELSKFKIISTISLDDIKVVESKKGWFELDPTYKLKNESISMSSMLKHFQKTKKKFMRKGHQWIKIPEIITEHDWKLNDSHDTIEVTAIGLHRLKASMGDLDRFVGKKQALKSLKEYISFTPPEKPADISLSNLNLREYQQEGLNWLWWLYQKNLHGLLADEMGLGKTHQAMALMSAIQKVRDNPFFLVICPTSVIDHWYDKAKQFAPNLKAVAYHGSKRHQKLKKAEGHYNTLITSYGVLIRDIKELSQREWQAIILDEAHLVKNNQTATYKAACNLNGNIRVCLTGTPIENDLSELKSIYDFLLPGFLGSDRYFRKTFSSPIENQKDTEAELTLQRLIYPFKLRRVKTEVLRDLPEKVEDLRHCSLSPAQVKLYKETLALKASGLIDQLKDENNPIPYLHVFATINMLKQICDHPALIEGVEKYKDLESGKFELAKELIDEAIGSGHKIVIFTQYLKMVDIFCDYFKENSIEFVKLVGATRNRGKVIDTFQTDPNCKVFVGSLLAGGMGIDLTAASVVIHYDRWWNASKENQATDRVHRIGQNKNVQVMKLVTKGTLEEKIDEIINRKKSLFDKFVNQDEDLFKNLSRSELIDLLE